MQFRLPRLTTRGLAAKVVVGAPKFGPSMGSGRGVEEGPDDASWGALGFAVGVPGELGEFAGVPRYGAEDDMDESLEAPEVVQKAPKVQRPTNIDELAKWPLEVRPVGPQMGAIFGARLVHDYQGAPGGFFRGLNYRVGSAARYVGASNWLRAQSRNLDLAWTEWGWADGPRQERFWAGVDAIQRRFQAGDGPQRAVKESARELRFEREEMENILRAGIVAGKFPRWDAELGAEALDWEDVESALLAMRVFTEEQVGLLSPWTGTPALQASLGTFASRGLIKAHNTGELGVPVWRVTDRAVGQGVESGVLSPREAEYRTSIRRGQLLHDLAVGDGILLVGMQLAKEGASVVDLQTETALLAARREGVFPDFVMTATRGGISREIPVEVVGVGANYRAAAKKAKVAAQGFKVFSPGFDGYGVRLG